MLHAIVLIQTTTKEETMFDIKEKINKLLEERIEYFIMVNENDDSMDMEEDTPTKDDLIAECLMACEGNCDYELGRIADLCNIGKVKLKNLFKQYGIETGLYKPISQKQLDNFWDAGCSIHYPTKNGYRAVTTINQLVKTSGGFKYKGTLYLISNDEVHNY